MCTAPSVIANILLTYVRSLLQLSTFDTSLFDDTTDDDDDDGLFVLCRTQSCLHSIFCTRLLLSIRGLSDKQSGVQVYNGNGTSWGDPSWPQSRSYAQGKGDTCHTYTSGPMELELGRKVLVRVDVAWDRE